MIFFYLHFTARDKNVVSRHKHLEQHGEAGEWVTHTFVQNRHFSKVVYVENQFPYIYIYREIDFQRTLPSPHYLGEGDCVKMFW